MSRRGGIIEDFFNNPATFEDEIFSDSSETSFDQSSDCEIVSSSFSNSENFVYIPSSSTQPSSPYSRENSNSNTRGRSRGRGRGSARGRGSRGSRGQSEPRR